MQLPIPKGVTVGICSSGRHLRFTSTNEKTLCQMAEGYAQRKGVRDVGSIRVTHCNITAQPGNYEPDLGVPSAHFMILVSHVNLEFAGDREPQTTTVYRTLKFREDHHGDPEQYFEYHFTAELK
jgi:hypothetical protein